MNMGLPLQQASQYLATIVSSPFCPRVVSLPLMLLACAVMIYGLIKHRAGVCWGRRAAVAGAIVTLVCALDQIVVVGGYVGSDHGPGEMAVNTAYARTSG